MVITNTVREMLLPKFTRSVAGYPHCIYLTPEGSDTTLMVYQAPLGASLNSETVRVLANRVEHDIKNPLTALKGGLELAKSEAVERRKVELIPKYNLLQSEIRGLMQDASGMGNTSSGSLEEFFDGLATVQQRYGRFRGILSRLPEVGEEYLDELFLRKANQDGSIDYLMRGLASLAQSTPGLGQTHLVERYFDMLRTELEKYGTVGVDLGDTIGHLALPNLDILYTQIMNFVSNSDKARKENGIKNELELTLSGWVKPLDESVDLFFNHEQKEKYWGQPMVFVTYRDNAGGVNQDKIKLHEMFDQGRSTGSSGLGLALSGLVLNRLGGSIIVETAGNGTPEGYTSFTHAFPLYKE